ncbi:hypothetical protein JOC85_001707 [Bacillus mesophilus]|uniref:YjzC family protein n=1 Tax=Bacillus mesophilus TaxID=1808955 RepID=A0A6M0Q5F6_9BACI|nr:hypothetical protein [Bacillus mesophilus]MBM7660935.1 hypothetical protein [Bacillus mesophilus]NEY71522.1 hypothetical protein [Bacillus mesophilus]
MNKNVEIYRTGQGVPVDGEYRCQSGQRLRLNGKEDFPVCPISGSDTTWTREKVDID